MQEDLSRPVPSPCRDLMIMPTGPTTKPAESSADPPEVFEVDDDDDDVVMTQYDVDSQFDDERAWMMMQDSQPPNLSPPPESPHELEDVQVETPTLEEKLHGFETLEGGVNGDTQPEDANEARHTYLKNISYFSLGW